MTPIPAFAGYNVLTLEYSQTGVARGVQTPVIAWLFDEDEVVIPMTPLGPADSVGAEYGVVLPGNPDSERVLIGELRLTVKDAVEELVRLEQAQEPGRGGGGGRSDHLRQPSK